MPAGLFHVVSEAYTLTTGGLPPVVTSPRVAVPSPFSDQPAVEDFNSAAAPAPNPNATGVVEFQPTDGMLTRRLRFEAGARTNWHTHTHRQMIWAEEGRGLYQEMGEPVKELVKDMPVLTKANVPHWHGATPDSHAIQASLSFGGIGPWLDPVTEAEYLGK